MIRLMTDKAADITPEDAEKYQIEILPFIVNLGEESMLADVNFLPQMFYEKLRKTDAMPSTSQMSPADVEDVYRRLTENGDAVIHVTMSGNGSGIFNTSTMVAHQLCEEEGLDITVIDSSMFSMAIGAVVIEGAKMAQAGLGKEEIISYMTGCFDRDTAYFLVDDLTFLKNGGRIKATTMAISSILDIKPILMINDGLVEAYKKVRGLKKAISVLANYAVERMECPEENEIILLHSDAGDKVQILSAMLEEKVHPKKISVYEIGPIITAHAGLGLIGLYFRHQKPYGTYEKK